jgi:heme iron utilization protein
MARGIDDATISSLLSLQNLGVLATIGEKYPYTSLVGFAATKDLKTLVFATMTGTRKYANLKKNPNVTILINSGKNSAEDFKEAVSVTVLGTACDASLSGPDGLRSLYLSKFPFLEDFIKDPACALVKVNIDKFIVVTRFQEVRELEA